MNKSGCRACREAASSISHHTSRSRDSLSLHTHPLTVGLRFQACCLQLPPVNNALSLLRERQYRLHWNMDQPQKTKSFTFRVASVSNSSSETRSPRRTMPSLHQRRSIHEAASGREGALLHMPRRLLQHASGSRHGSVSQDGLFPRLLLGMHRDTPLIERDMPSAVVRRRSVSTAGCVRAVCGLQERACGIWLAGGHRTCQGDLMVSRVVYDDSPRKMISSIYPSRPNKDSSCTSAAR